MGTQSTDSGVRRKSAAIPGQSREEDKIGPLIERRLLELLRCPDCGSRLGPQDTSVTCIACRRRYRVRDGVPRFSADATPTATSFGYSWGLHSAKVGPPQGAEPFHLHAMRDALGAPRLNGLILDAGCGDGTDLAMLALNDDCEVIGVELSSGGVDTSLARTRGIPRGQVVQADLLQLPFAADTFDFAYSYGVVHHTPDPRRAVRELARSLIRGGSLLLYVYEDFSDRTWPWRAALGLVNAARLITTRLRPSILMFLCRALAPIVFLCCTLPSRRFRWAARFPYRHNRAPWDAAADLYDRFAPPIEHRYSKEGAALLAEQAGLEVVRTTQCRGWMVWARKPR